MEKEKEPIHVTIDGFTGVYFGEWKNDKPHGFGEFQYITNNDVQAFYCGNFSDGCRDG